MRCKGVKNMNYTMKYRYSDEQWRALAQSNCVQLAQIMGLEFDEKQSNKEAYKIKGSGGLHVFRNGKGFTKFSTGEKGGAMNFVKAVQGGTTIEAANFIHDRLFGGAFGKEFIATANRNQSMRQAPNRQQTIPQSIPRTAVNQQRQMPKTQEYQEPLKTKGSFILPETGRANRAYMYLTATRKIDAEIVSDLMKQGKIKQDTKHGNVMFVGYDKSGTARSCSLRGTVTFGEPYKGFVANSDKKFGFTMNGNSSTLKVFEAAISAMSNANLVKMMSGEAWKKDTYLALGGVSSNALLQLWEDFPDRYNRIVLCLDNDNAGGKGVAEISKQLSELYGGKYQVTVKVPRNNDWNDDLTELKTVMERTGLPFREAFSKVQSGEINVNSAGNGSENSDNNLPEPPVENYNNFDNGGWER
jgi:hypothetical protein